MNPATGLWDKQVPDMALVPRVNILLTQWWRWPGTQSVEVTKVLGVLWGFVQRVRFRTTLRDKSMKDKWHFFYSYINTRLKRRSWFGTPWREHPLSVADPDAAVIWSRFRSNFFFDQLVYTPRIRQFIFWQVPNDSMQALNHLGKKNCPLRTI